MNSAEPTAVIPGAATNDNVGVVYVRSAKRPPLFSDDECDAVIAWAKGRRFVKRGYSQKNEVPKRDQDRKGGKQILIDSRISGERIAWFVRKVEEITFDLNRKIWRFDITRLGTIVILRYDEGDRFQQHVQLGTAPLRPQDRRVHSIVAAGGLRRRRPRVRRCSGAQGAPQARRRAGLSRLGAPSRDTGKVGHEIRGRLLRARAIISVIVERRQLLRRTACAHIAVGLAGHRRNPRRARPSLPADANLRPPFPGTGWDSLQAPGVAGLSGAAARLITT